MKDIIRKLSRHSLVRYLAIASGIVVGELIIFQWVYELNKNYVIATVISFALAVVVNWFLSRKVVFGASAHHPAKELLYVTIVSIVGLGIQLLVVSLCVNELKLYPLLGKVLSIFASFFWNYWFRAHFIFSKTASPDDIVERIDTSVF